MNILGGSQNFHVLANAAPTDVRSWDGIVKGIVSLYDSAEGPVFLLVHANTRTHAKRVCRQFLHDENIDAIDWPSPCPDLNPTENLLDIMYSRIR